MSRPALDLETDIRPITDFGAEAPTVLKQIQASGRPVILTQDGRSAAVLLDVRSYQAMVEELDLLRDIGTARRQYQAGEGVEHSEAMAALKARLGG